MTRKFIYADQLQFDYFSDSYVTFEEDFYRYSNLDIPLIFLTDDILREMAMSQKNYFKLNKENARDKQDHYFYFRVHLAKEASRVRYYHYIGTGLTADEKI